MGWKDDWISGRGWKIRRWNIDEAPGLNVGVSKGDWGIFGFQTKIIKLGYQFKENWIEFS